MKAKQCAECGKDTFKEYSMAVNGGRRPKIVEAWLCNNDCASKYFQERIDE